MRFGTGENLVRAMPFAGSDAAPVVARVVLDEEAPKRVTLRSTGWCGCVRIDLHGVPAPHLREQDAFVRFESLSSPNAESTSARASLHVPWDAGEGPGP